MGFNIQTQYYTVKEISSLLKLNELTIYKYIRELKLEAIELGGHFRVSAESLQKFLNNHKTKKGVFSNEK